MREFSYESSSAGVGEEGGTAGTGSAEYDEENYQSYDDSDFDSEMVRSYIHGFVRFSGFGVCSGWRRRGWRRC